MCNTTNSITIQTPVLQVGGSMRGSAWIWLCPKHQYAGEKLEVAQPQPRAGNVCVSVQDLHEDIYTALANAWPALVLSMGVPAGAAAAAAGADHEVIFSDLEVYTVPDAVLLHPLQLPELMEVEEEGGDSDQEEQEEEERAPPARAAPRSSQAPRQAAAAAAAAIAAEAANAPKATGCDHPRRCVASFYKLYCALQLSCGVCC
jgi:hypothetical protein